MMGVCLLLAVALLVGLIASEESPIGESELRAIRARINNGTEAFCYHSHSGARQAFVSKQYRQFFASPSPSASLSSSTSTSTSSSIPNVLVYPFCLTTNELGNKLGNLFYEITCAEASGLHFVAVHPKWELDGSFQKSNSSSQDVDMMKKGQLAFLNALPDVIVHQNPLDFNHASANIQHLCKCTRYCWQHKAPWVNHTDSIKRYIQTAVKTYLHTLGDDALTIVDPENDQTNAPQTQKLPLIPDATIHYRCGDNIAFNYMYGILPFTVFDSRIPQDAKYIYVLSDHPSRAMSSPYTSRCKLILEKLFEYLKNKFPTSIIVIKRGGDIFLDYARIALSRTVICSASSYCFWPAVSNGGQAHFPLTYLIAGADSIDLAPSFGPHFNWITDAQIISNFKGLKPWTQIIDVLEGKMAFPH